MNSKLFFIFFSVILLMNFVSPALTISTNAGESIQPNFILNITAINDTQNINSNINCSILLTSPNGNVEYQNISSTSLTQNLSNLNISTDKLNVACWTPTETGATSQLIKITSTGENSGDFVTTLIWLLFIIAVVGNIFFFFITIYKLALAQETLIGVLTTWGFYVLMIIVSFMSGFLTSPFTKSISDFFLTILVWSNGVLPLISLIITMFIKGTQKKKPLSVQDFTGGVGKYGG